VTADSVAHFKMNFVQLNTLVNLFVVSVHAFGQDFESERDVLFLLRIRDRPFNNEEVFRLENKADVVNSAFDSNKQTTFLVHGFLEGRQTRHHLKLSK
jgi:hypothetical protein